MIRSSARVCNRLVLSAALSWTLLPIAVAEAQSSPEADSATSSEASPDATSDSPSDTSSDASSSDSSSSNTSSGDTSAQTDTVAKPLYTVPEDGMGDTTWLSGATRIVREITLKRPHEDLVICIAGCNPKLERVVYAQPAEIVTKKPTDVATQGSPAAASAPAVAPAPVAAQPEAAMPAIADGKASQEQLDTSKLPVAAAEEKKPAIAGAAKATATSAVTMPEFVPSMAVPQMHAKPE